ncbi:MAG: four helix bundle protein [Nonlabens sp.]|uniref:four helix bundle protein n=1 Tax=Nonlabens sp. TaxID=1888209 RepID=UPI003EF9024C
MRNYKELRIWSDSMELVTAIYKFTALLPDSEKFGLISQINRAAVSVPANIAEGCAKDSNADFLRFLRISQGSLFELDTLIQITKNIALTELSPEDISIKINALQKSIGSMISYNKNK